MVKEYLIEDKDLYEAIFHRKSVRNYKPEPLDKETLSRVKEFIGTLIPLYEDIKTQFIFLGPEDIKSRIPQKKAPHYIGAFSQKKEGYRTNIGFMLQQMDLFLSANGIGSCWQGTPQPKREIIDSSPLEFVILLAFGSPDETLHRSRGNEFKRKSLKEIADVEGDAKFLEPARLAPSATNNQPWFFCGNANKLSVYCKEGNFIKARLLKKWKPIDMGIAIYHLWLHFKVDGKKVELVKDPSLKVGPKGYQYIGTLKIEGN